MPLLYLAVFLSSLVINLLVMTRAIRGLHERRVLPSALPEHIHVGLGDAPKRLRCHVQILRIATSHGYHEATPMARG